MVGGTYWNPGDTVNGSIDEVRIWNIARSQSDIQSKMNTILAGNEPGLVSYYQFENLEDLGIGGDGEDDYRDYSPNANHVNLFHEQPPPCALNLALTYIDENLNLEFIFRTSEPTTWNGWLSFLNWSIPLWLNPLPVLDSMVSFSIPIPGFPSVGNVGVLTNLTTQEHGIICSQWQTVSTGPMPTAKAFQTPEELKKLFKNYQ